MSKIYNTFWEVTTMDNIKVQHEDLTGERALFRKSGLLIEDCYFHDGESPLKEGKNLKVKKCTFGYKYPLWYGKGHLVENSKFLEMARSGIWYTDDSTFQNCDIIAPKLFRRCSNIVLKNLHFHDAKETLWSCNKVSLRDIKVENGDYFGKDSSNITVENLFIDGNYCFDGAKNIVVKDSVLHSKDAFWNCENVVLINCRIEGEYFAWNTKNIRLEHCHIVSHQGFCYMDNVSIVDSTIEDSDLIFEYCSNLDVSVRSKLLSVKNPTSGIIRSSGIEELIMNEDRIPGGIVHFETLEDE